MILVSPDSPEILVLETMNTLMALEPPDRTGSNILYKMKKVLPIF